MKFSRKDVFTVPNILTYIRLLCVPVFFALMVMFCIDPAADMAKTYVWAAFGVFVFAEVTDVVDGFVARHFNLITDLGKVIDPVADKLCQGFGILMLGVAYLLIDRWPIVLMGVFSYYFMKASKRQVEQIANKWGKAGSALNFASLVLAYFALGLLCYEGDVYTAGNVIYWIAFAVFVAGALVAVYNVVQYNVGYYRDLCRVRESGILDKLDEKGNPIEGAEQGEDKE